MEEISIFKCNFCFREWDEYESQRKFRLKNVVYVITKYVKHVFIIKIINKNVLVVNWEILQDLKINVFKIQNYGKNSILCIFTQVVEIWFLWY